MTNLKQTTIVFAFAALLALMPLATPLANAVSHTEATVTLDAVCSFVIDPTLSFGTLTAGVDGLEQIITFDKATATEDTLIEVKSDNWIGTDSSQAFGTVTLVNVADTETITVGSNTYTGLLTPVLGTDFDINGDDIADATELVSAITATDTSVSADNEGGTSNVVTITAVTLIGDAGNDVIALEENVADAGTLVSGPFLTGGADNVVHMLAEATKFSVSNDGNAPTLSTYAAKIAFPAEGAIAQDLISIASPSEHVIIAFHLSGDGTLLAMPYSGILTQEITFTQSCV